MEAYVYWLSQSRLPFGVGVTVASWVVLFAVNHLLVRRARAENEAQATVVMEGKALLRRGSQPLFVLLQLLFAAALFFVAGVLGGVAFTFFAGGQLVSIAFTLGLNLQSLLSARSLVRDGGAQGSLTLSTDYVFAQGAQRMAGAAVTSALLGVLIAHAAPLGGALLLGSTAAGLQRRSRQARTAAGRMERR